jgi:linoleoyl-CoA desaturase
MNFTSLKFNRTEKQDFVRTLRKRVNDYFQSNNISRYANAAMVIKTIVLLGTYAALYAFVLSGISSSIWLNLAVWSLMGIVTAGIGFSVMHDANHGAYSRNKTVNAILGYVINFIGGFSQNWKIQHNTLHHSYTNVHGMDEDIDAGKLLRFSPEQELLPFHKFQHVYAWFLYSLMTHMWITTKDFKQLLRYKNNGMLKQHGASFSKTFAELIFIKVMYYAYLLVIPIVFAGVAWWVTLIGFIIMHFILGFLLACVFQTAHVMSTTEFPAPDEEGKLENNWAIHQLLTTTNYAPGNRLLSWFVGGLNFQVEHHLFPNICHIHYKKISKIVKETAEEYGLPYNTLPSFRSALTNHADMLKMLGTGRV